MTARRVSLTCAVFCCCFFFHWRKNTTSNNWMFSMNELEWINGPCCRICMDWCSVLRHFFLCLLMGSNEGKEQIIRQWSKKEIIINVIFKISISVFYKHLKCYWSFMPFVLFVSLYKGKNNKVMQNRNATLTCQRFDNKVVGKSALFLINITLNTSK